ncbi:bacteriocin immunity protein [Carnobacterium maltaromaticum]|uniref:bacteriocin immunity protein n=1 Tax=Carnobacterium maltaromaticum TaxID=2751 RepID=UPI00191BBC5B|nr:bacteriocin immunity protein [Carnobacterium maltaromaticum]CAD5902718.1 putative leucocin-A immunity protein [Carnobacterium maltaromaticum]
MDKVDKVKENIHELYNSLIKRSGSATSLLDITEVLLQVYIKIDTTENPEALVNRLVNYIYSVGLKGRIKLAPVEGDLLIELGVFAQRAGLNGLYRADFSDKSQFYSYFDKNQMPRH